MSEKVSEVMFPTGDGGSGVTVVYRGSFIKKAVHRAWQHAARGYSTAIVTEVRANHAYTDRSGDTTKLWGWDQRGNMFAIKGQRGIARWLEVGTAKMAPRPSVTPAAESKKDVLMSALKDSVK